MKLGTTAGAALWVVVSVCAQAADGKAIYDRTCAACHLSGVANAPKLGDKVAWGTRAQAGAGSLVQSVVKGKGAMPARAGNPKLTEVEIKAAVEYMISAAR